MIRTYVNESGRLSGSDGLREPLDGVVWIDLVDPSKDEEARLEALLGVDLPTKEEMEEIEISSRLYNEDGAAFMTANLIRRGEHDQPPQRHPPRARAGAGPRPPRAGAVGGGAWVGRGGCGLC